MIMIVETDFEIGEVVVCINARRKWYKLGGLKKNELYTVEGFNPYDGGLILKEAKSPTSGYNAYRVNRFRKVDYAFAESVINEIRPTKSKNRELVNSVLQLLSERLVLPLLN